MTLQYFDRVKETTSVVGIGPYNLLGAVVGFRSFAVVGNGNTCYYAAWDGGFGWEVGVGTYSISGGTLTRTTISASSNGGSAVAWLPGIKTIWLDFPADAIGQLAGGSTQIVTGSGTVTVLPGTGLLILNKSIAGATPISLPAVAARLNLPLTIVDWAANAADLTISPAGGESIEKSGQTSLVVTTPDSSIPVPPIQLIPSTDVAGWLLA